MPSNLAQQKHALDQFMVACNTYKMNNINVTPSSQPSSSLDEERQRNAFEQLFDEAQVHPDGVFWTYISSLLFDNKGTETWIRKEVDVDGYFLLQHGDNDMFLTSENTSSLTIKGK